jgi:hypothetical protein
MYKTLATKIQTGNCSQYFWTGEILQIISGKQNTVEDRLSGTSWTWPAPDERFSRILDILTKNIIIQEVSKAVPLHAMEADGGEEV